MHKSVVHIVCATLGVLAAGCFVQGDLLGAPCNGSDGAAACDAGQVCSRQSDGVCVDAGCFPGQVDCPCNADDLCDPGLACSVAGICEVASSCAPEGEVLGCPCNSNDDCGLPDLGEDGFVCSQEGRCVEADGGPAAPGGVDILLVMDNSSSMALRQARFAREFGNLLSGLNVAQVDWRLGITTTDNGNPWCAGTPQAGSLVLSSCRQRLGEFTTPDGQGNLEQEGCLDHCTLDALPVLDESTPWLENIEGAKNYDDSLSSLIDIAACAVPMGVKGCGFESPLESMLKAIARSSSRGDPSEGFLRPDANLVIILVTDEADCSYQDPSIFETSGNRVFWSDPEAAFPTSAVCWNAGTVCAGDPLECSSADKNVDGGFAETTEEAVLHPLGRYGDILELEGDRATMVFGIVGVTADGQFDYVLDGDPTFVHDFGIGPGCSDLQNLVGIPPVRMREIAEGFHANQQDSNFYSICAEQYQPHFEDIAAIIVERLQ